MAYVAPDWDVWLSPPLPGCADDNEEVKYEPTWVAEATLWERVATHAIPTTILPRMALRDCLCIQGHGLGIFDEEKQDRMRRAQGLYTVDGQQSGEIGDVTDVNALGKL